MRLGANFYTCECTSNSTTTLVAQVDRIAGPRGRSGFVRAAVEQAVRQETRWAAIEAAAGAIADEGHEWDDDPVAWVRKQRRADARRAG